MPAYFYAPLPDVKCDYFAPSLTRYRLSWALKATSTHYECLWEATPSSLSTARLLHGAAGGRSAITLLYGPAGLEILMTELGEPMFGSPCCGHFVVGVIVDVQYVFLIASRKTRREKWVWRSLWRRRSQSSL